MRLQVVCTKALESEPNPRQRSIFSAWFRHLYWCQQKLILSQRNKAVNGVRLVPKAPTVYIKVILQFLGGLLGGLPFRRDWLQLGGMSLYRTLSLFLSILCRSWGGD